MEVLPATSAAGPAGLSPAASEPGAAPLDLSALDAAALDALDSAALAALGLPAELDDFADDGDVDLAGVPFAGVQAAALAGDVALFQVPERRWDVPVAGAAPDTPEAEALEPAPRKRPRKAAVVPGSDQLAIPGGAQASSLSQLGLSNIYSTSGFDTLAILAKLYNRPAPRVDLGPIDCSSSFIVVDATKEDYPIVYVSENFTKLTGYGLNEVLGRNCRFLQAPDGIVRKGSVRKYVDNNVIFQLKMSVEQFQEAQFTQINYKKGGSPFVNMITIIPLAWDSDQVRYFVGFQVDLEDQSRRILKRMFEGTYFFPASRTRARAIQGPSIDDEDVFEPSRSRPARGARPPPRARDRDPPPSRRRAAEDDGGAMLHPRKLAENQRDFAFILSSRGIFLYATAKGCEATVGYQAADLVGRTLADFIHPHDLPSVARDLRACKPGSPMTAVFRFRRKERRDGGEYVWLETHGHKYELDNRKRTKCFVLSAREKVVDVVVPSVLIEETPVLDRMTLSDGQGEHLRWAKLSLEGLVLYASKGLGQAMDGNAASLYARKLWDFLDAEGAQAARAAVAELKARAKAGGPLGPPARFAGRLKRGKGWVQAVFELHCVGVHPAHAIFAAVETAAGDPGALRDALAGPAPAAAEDEAKIDWSLLEVRNQSSLQHKQNWLRVQNKKLLDTISELAGQA
ncbi:hypothetical protein DFJ74DRAFT_601273 [Hyaloraphidium curvatum]|nr:hypothetical protein DFJ74DRAFT_601273 [Hyaloraphidium curvatum]